NARIYVTSKIVKASRCSHAVLAKRRAWNVSSCARGRQTLAVEKALERKVVIDEHGFCTLDAGAELRFIMSPDVLECVDYMARITRTDRGYALMATIVGDEIDPDAPIFTEARVVENFEPTVGQRGPLTFVLTIGCRRFGVQIMSTQDSRAAASDGEAITA